MIPLSFAQRRLWFVDRFEGPSPTYNGAFALRLTGELSVAALESALRDIIDRHEVLRTVIVEGDDGVPHQQVLGTGEQPFALPVVEVAQDALAAAVDEVATATFDLAADAPIRARLLKSGPGEHTLVVVAHHIAVDGESFGPLFRDLTEAYAARRQGSAPAWEPLPVQYADYTLWQLDLLGDENDPESVAARQLAYWRDALADLPQPLAIPTDRPRPRAMSAEGDRIPFSIEPGLLASVEKLAAQQDTTVSMVMHAALAVLLHHLGCGDDVSIGAPITDRTDEDLRDLVGFFVNTWVLRADLSGNPTFRQLLQQVRDRSLAAYDNQDMPFERLVQLLNPDRSTAYNPFFQVMLSWQPPCRPWSCPASRSAPSGSRPAPPSSTSSSTCSRTARAAHSAVSSTPPDSSTGTRRRASRSGSSVCWTGSSPTRSVRSPPSTYSTRPNATGCSGSTAVTRKPPS